MRRALAAGEIAPGDELPSVRQLAADLGINWNTVARAYRELETQGLVRTSRGKGTRVVAARERRAESKAEARARIEEGIRRALVDAKLAGFSPRETKRIVEAETGRLAPVAREVGA